MAKTPAKPAVAEIDSFDQMRSNWIAVATAQPVVRQQGEMNCGPACAEMLFADRGYAIDQAVIANGLPLARGVRAPTLADKMNEFSFTRIAWDGELLGMAECWSQAQATP